MPTAAPNGRPTTRTDGISRRGTSPAASAAWRARAPWKEWSQETASAGRSTGRPSAGSGTDGAGLASQIDVQAGGEFLGLAHTREVGSENQPRQRFFRMRLTFRMHCHAREARRSQPRRRRRPSRGPGARGSADISITREGNRQRKRHSSAARRDRGLVSGQWSAASGHCSHRSLVHGTLIVDRCPRAHAEGRPVPASRPLFFGAFSPW